MDISYLLFLQNLRNTLGNTLDSFMLWISTLAEGTITYLLLACIYWCVDKRAGQLMGWNVSIGCVWSQFLKGICKVKRPWVKDERIIPVEAAVPGAGGYSFPSGHTARAIANWGSLGHYLQQMKQKSLSLVCWGIVLMVVYCLWRFRI